MDEIAMPHDAALPTDADEAPAEGIKRYNLFTRDGTSRFVWRLTDEGIAIEPNGLALMRGGRWTRARFADILSVTLSSGSIGTSATLGSCVIQLGNGSRIVVTNANARGVSDGFRDGLYSQFVTDFHQQLVASGAARAIEFHSGFSEGKSSGLFIVMLIAAAFFVLLPFVLLLATGDLQVLWILVAGIGLVIPVYRTFSRNQPSEYNPKLPPDLLS